MVQHIRLEYGAYGGASLCDTQCSEKFSFTKQTKRWAGASQKSDIKCHKLCAFRSTVWPRGLCLLSAVKRRRLLSSSDSVPSCFSTQALRGGLTSQGFYM